MALIIEVVFFFIAAFFFFAFFYVGLDMFSSVFVTGYRTVPAFVSYFLPSYLLFLFHRLSSIDNKETLIKRAHVNGAIIICLSLYVITMDICYFLLGVYPSLVDSSLLPLYPLDTLLIALLSLAAGLYLYVDDRAKRLWIVSSSIYSEKRIGVLSDWVKSIGAIFSLYYLGALLWGIDSSYYDSPYFIYLIPLFMAMTAFIALFAYDVIIESNPIKELDKKRKTVILSALSVFATASIIATGLIFIFISDIVVIVGQPYFRLDVVTSLNLAPFLLIILPALYMAYLWAMLYLRKKKNA